MCFICYSLYCLMFIVLLWQCCIVFGNVGVVKFDLAVVFYFKLFDYVFFQVLSLNGVVFNVGVFFYELIMFFFIDYVYKACYVWMLDSV